MSLMDRVAATISGREFLSKLEHCKRGFRSGAALVEKSGIAPGNGLRLIFDGENAVAHGIALKRQLHEPARALIGNDLEMISFAAHHDAKADECTKAAASCRKRNRGGNFERSRDRQRFMLVASRFDRLARAGEQHIVEMRVEARFDEKECRHQASISIGRSSTIAKP